MFNEEVDKVAFKPVATAYQAIVPSIVRTGMMNFFSNIGDPWSAANLILQGRMKEGFSDIARFGTNTVLGVLGLADFASGWGLPHHGEDFGQTLGVVMPSMAMIWRAISRMALRPSARRAPAWEGLPVLSRRNRAMA